MTQNIDINKTSSAYNVSNSYVVCPIAHKVKALDKRSALNIEKEAWTNLLLISGWTSPRAATLLIT
jgi:hypothetical protein